MKSLLDTPKTIVWTDFETTGIDENKNMLLEMSLVITDLKLNTLLEYSRLFTMKQSHPNGMDLNILECMNEYVTNMHTNNGLLTDLDYADTFTSSCDRTYSYIDSVIYDKMKEIIGDDKPWLAGSTINFDRKYWELFLPQSFELLHYRNLDVTSLRNAMYVLGWDAIKIDATRTKDEDKKHRTLDDITDSIEYLKYLGEISGGLGLDRLLQNDQ